MLRIVSTVVFSVALAISARQADCQKVERATPQVTSKPGKKNRRPRLRWPRFTRAQRDIIKSKIKELGHGNEKIANRAKETLKAFGPGVVPFMARKLSDSSPKLNKHMEEIALSVMEEKYAPLVVPYLKSRLKSVRMFGIRLIVKTGWEGAKEALKKAYAKEKDAGVKEAMALALCSLGEIDAIDVLFELAKKDFFSRRQDILNAARGLKGEKAERWLLERLGSDSARDKIAALRLLAVSGTKDSVKSIKRFLYSNNHTLAVAALNALRAIVDGKEPIEHISVFDLIRMRREWEKRQ